MSRLLTYSGRMFDVLTPDPETIDPIDIAHALSNLCRFTGHTRHFYSVAQHSVLVAELVPAADRLAALLHDATEAYVNDVSTPLKIHLSNYAAFEHRVWRAIALRFGLPAALPKSVKLADRIALATEKRDLMPAHPDPWPILEGVDPWESRITPLPPQSAKLAWLNTFELLMGQSRRVTNFQPALLRAQER